MLVEDLQAKKEAGYELILATEHAKHYNRVQGILQDVEANITMHPLNLDLHGGFVDHQNKILVYTDHQYLIATTRQTFEKIEAVVVHN